MARQIVACVLLLLWFLALPVFGQVSVNVLPKAAMVNPYKRVAFSFTWRIEPNPDNRTVILSADCGREAHRSVRESWAKLNQTFVQLTVLAACEFKVCVIRMVEGKEKTDCDKQLVLIPGGEE